MGLPWVCSMTEEISPARAKNETKQSNRPITEVMVQQAFQGQNPVFLAITGLSCTCPPKTGFEPATDKKTGSGRTRIYVYI